MNWISIKDKLPERLLSVLVFDDTFKKYDVGYYEPSDDPIHQWLSDDDCCSHWLDVSHWMPLPESPGSLLKKICQCCGFWYETNIDFQKYCSIDCQKRQNNS